MAGLPTFWINLEASIKRRESIIKEFARVGATHCTRIAAMEPKDLMQYNIKRPAGLKELLPEEYCCTLSHLKAIHTAYSSGAQEALILEDDARIIRWPAFGKVWAKLKSSAPDSWEILQLLALGKPIEKKLKDDKAELWIRWQDGIYSSCAYVINKIGMIKLLQTYVPDQIERSIWKDTCDVNVNNFNTKNPRERFVADWALFAVADTWTFTDVLFREEGEDSTIKPDELALHKPTLQVIADRTFAHAYKIEL